jgi:hypothetical protein
MHIDRPRLDELLTEIAQKKIDCDTAARSLLGIARPEPTSMLTLVKRLGPPPREVEEDWTRQIQEIARAWLVEQNQQLPPLTLADWLVDFDNRVTLLPQTVAECRRQAFSSQSPAKASCKVSSDAAADCATSEGFTDSPVFTDGHSTPAGGKAHARKVSRRRYGPQQTLVASIAGVAVAFLILVTIFRNAGDDNPASVQYRLGSPPNVPPSLSANHQTSEAGTESPMDDVTQLQASVMQHNEPDLPLAPLATADLLRPDFGLGNPLLSGVAIEPPESDPEKPSFGSPPPSDADSPEAESSDVEDQSVQSASPRQAVTLPPLRIATNRGPNDQEAILEQTAVIAAEPVRAVQWDFPAQINVQFAATEDDSNPGPATKRWTWTDTASGVELATLLQVQQELLFRWSEHALANPLARQLAAGRLRVVGTTGQSSVVFMRPHLRTSPLRLEANTADARYHWPLEGPAIYQNPLLNLEVTKTENVDLAWIETPDPTNIRKQIATLQWTPAGKPSPAIRCQIECRVNTKLQMRLRYFAQLESTFPWQPYSSIHLNLALDQVTQLLERRASELSQMEQQYRNATTSEKRSIRPIKENIEKSVNQMQSILQRLQNLNILHSAIVATSHLQMSLTTQWPDGIQTILEIPLPDQ